MPEYKPLFDFIVCPVNDDTKFSSTSRLVFDEEEFEKQLAKMIRQALAKRKHSGGDGDDEDGPKNSKRMKIAEPWKCGACAKMNPDDEGNCLNCNQRRPLEGGKILGWGNLFASFTKENKSKWKCDMCKVLNPENMSKCVSCKTFRPGRGPSDLAEATGTMTATDSGSIASSGFTSGAPSSGAVTASGFTFGTTATGSNGFTFGESSTGSCAAIENSNDTTGAVVASAGFTFGASSAASNTATANESTSGATSAPSGFTFG